MNILCAYNANIDAIYHVGGKELSCMLQGEDIKELREIINDAPGFISSREHFFAGLIMCMQNGIGAEWMVLETEVFEWLKQTFLADSLMRMGGNMGIMSNVLSELGASRVIPNVASLSELQTSFFSKKAVFHPYMDKLYSSTEISNIIDNKKKLKDLIHFVFDFKKGDKFTINREVIVVPRENRFIATYDPLNFSLYIDEHFKNYAHKHANEMHGAIISGYHLLQHPDGQKKHGSLSKQLPKKKIMNYAYKQRLNSSTEQLQSWKDKRDDIRIHVELGHFSNDDIASYAFSILSPVVDSIGMNEDELAMLAHIHGMETRNILEMDPVLIAQVAIELCKNYDLSKILVHTREFVLSVSCMNDDPDKVIEAIDFGVRCAAAFACSGKLADRNTLLDISSEIEESELGIAACSRLARHIEEKRMCSSVCGVYMSFQVSMVPTRVCDDPVSKVGLGDTISAAIFLRELELFA